MESYFKEYSQPEFAKAGAVPEKTITVEPGPLPFPISMMQELRKMGMVVEVEDGKLVLREALTVAVEGVPLTPEQAKILTKLDIKIIDFKMNLICRWEDGKYHEY